MYKFGERLKYVRKQLDISQKMLAERLGISYVTVSQWESGKRIPKGRTARRIAEALEVPVHSLLDYYPCVAPILESYEAAIEEMDEKIKNYEWADAADAPGYTRSYTAEIEAAEMCKDLLEDTVNNLVTQAIIHPVFDVCCDYEDEVKTKEAGRKGERPDDERRVERILEKMLLGLKEAGVSFRQYQLLKEVSPHIFFALYKVMGCAIEAGGTEKTEEIRDILARYGKLNATGKEVLRQRMEELIEIPRYTYPIEEENG